MKAKHVENEVKSKPQEATFASQQDEEEVEDNSFFKSFDEKIMTIYDQMKNANENQNQNSNINPPPPPSSPPPPPPASTPPPLSPSLPPPPTPPPHEITQIPNTKTVEPIENSFTEIPESIKNEIPIEDLENINNYDNQLDNSIDINEINLKQVANDVQERAQKFLEQLQNNDPKLKPSNSYTNTRNSDRIEGLSFLSSTILDDSNEVSEISDSDDVDSSSNSLNDTMRSKSNYYYVSPLASFRMSTSSFTSDLSDFNLVKGKEDMENENDNSGNIKSIKMKDESSQFDSKFSVVVNPIESIINLTPSSPTQLSEHSENQNNNTKQQLKPASSENDNNIKIDDVLELLNEV